MEGVNEFVQNLRCMLTAAFVRTVGERDRIHVTRSNGSEVSWVFPTYGDVLPHDMIHLIVESAYGVKRGFWGRVDAGLDPRAAAEKMNRLSGHDKYAAFGDDLGELLLAEALANAGWVMIDSSVEDLYAQIAAACGEMSIVPPVLLSTERVAQVRSVILHLSRQWKGFRPKGAIQLQFDPLNPVRGFEQTLKEAEVNQG